MRCFLSQFDRPIRVVEELLPAMIPLMAQVHMNGRITFWFYRLFYKSHTRLSRHFAAFFCIAASTGTDDVFPCRGSSAAFRDYVVER